MNAIFFSKWFIFNYCLWRYVVEVSIKNQSVLEPFFFFFFFNFCANILIKVWIGNLLIFVSNFKHLYYDRNANIKLSRYYFVIYVKSRGREGNELLTIPILHVYYVCFLVYSKNFVNYTLFMRVEQIILHNFRLF